LFSGFGYTVAKGKTTYNNNVKAKNTIGTPALPTAISSSIKFATFKNAAILEHVSQSATDMTNIPPSLESTSCGY